MRENLIQGSCYIVTIAVDKYYKIHSHDSFYKYLKFEFRQNYSHLKFNNNYVVKKL